MLKYPDFYYDSIRIHHPDYDKLSDSMRFYLASELMCEWIREDRRKHPFLFVTYENMKKYTEQDNAGKTGFWTYYFTRYQVFFVLFTLFSWCVNHPWISGIPCTIFLIYGWIHTYKLNYYIGMRRRAVMLHRWQAGDSEFYNMYHDMAMEMAGINNLGNRWSGKDTNDIADEGMAMKAELERQMEEENS